MTITKHYIKLADLGSTRGIATKMTAGAGTMYWTASEVLNCGRYDTSADIYSFGVVLTELDTLLLPYSNLKLTPFQIQTKVCNESLRCDTWHKNLVNRCLASDPEERPPASKIVCLLENCLSGKKSQTYDIVEKATLQLTENNNQTPSEMVPKASSKVTCSCDAFDK
ncbi:kinase [Thraustotheca clavata]|uniref:Kinase n=1 Tax=Thraustotheca clavata TaxID=74557 RepID=A0A1W0A0Y0_9STRA|nr:kinase [Thraustotheca clavata]